MENDLMELDADDIAALHDEYSEPSERAMAAYGVADGSGDVDTIDDPPNDYGQDSAGNFFDPEIHVLENGKPKKTLRGRYAKKRGRKTTQKTSDEKTDDKIHNGLGITATMAHQSISTAIYGSMGFPEIGKFDKQETDFSIIAWEEYFRAQKIESIPPWALVMQSLVMIHGSRVSELTQNLDEKQKEKVAYKINQALSLFSGTVRGIFSGIFGFINRKKNKNEKQKTDNNKTGNKTEIRPDFIDES